MNGFEERSKIIIGIFILVGVVFLGRLFYIQVLDKDYKQFANDNSLRKETIYPARGLIYDRNGNILVRNVTIYDVMVIPAKVKDLDTNALCKLLEVDKSDFEENFEKAKYYSRFKPSPIVKQITPAQYGRFQERMFEFRGFYVEARTMRSYPLGVAAHAIGYLGEANDEDIASGGYYKMGDYIGMSGLEKFYEPQLRGQKGIRMVMVDVLNREQGRYMDGKEDSAAIPGKDLNTGMDLKLQQYAEKLLRGKKGAVVALDPNTGEILAMASMPDYDPNLLLGRERAHNYGKMILDPDKPLFNRAISARYPPGSTLKTVEALIAMQEHVINKSTTYSCSGGYHLSAAHTIHCHASGTFDMAGAIKMSCNTYYCNVFRMMVDQRRYGNPAEGLDDWATGLNSFGLGTRLGIDIPNENKGLVPNAKYYDRHYGHGAWKSSNIISLGIGQAEISLTPLQLVNQAAIIANRGYYITPHFVRSISSKDKNGEIKTEVVKWPKKYVKIDSTYFNLVVDAMEQVVEHGTAYFLKNPNLSICGKTGTAENPHGKDHAIFIGFAPKNHPKICVVAIVENAGFGATWAAPIATMMMEKYINDSISNPRWEQWILDAKYLKKGNEQEVAKKDEKGVR
jgi:penicillin-binding protein 2